MHGKQQITTTHPIDIRENNKKRKKLFYSLTINLISLSPRVWILHVSTAFISRATLLCYLYKLFWEETRSTTQIFSDRCHTAPFVMQRVLLVRNHVVQCTMENIIRKEHIFTKFSRTSCSSIVVHIYGARLNTAGQRETLCVHSCAKTQSQWECRIEPERQRVREFAIICFHGVVGRKNFTAAVAINMNWSSVRLWLWEIKISICTLGVCMHCAATQTSAEERMIIRAR